MDLTNARQVVAYDIYFDRTIDQILSKAKSVHVFLLLATIQYVCICIYFKQASFFYSTNHIFIHFYWIEIVEKIRMLYIMTCDR